MNCTRTGGVVGLLLALSVASPAFAKPAPKLSFAAAKKELASDLAQRTLQASWDASFALPTTTSTDEQGRQSVEYTQVTSDSALSNCARVSARRVRCDWRVWVAVADTGQIVAREGGTNVASLRTSPHRHVTVSAWVMEARRRGLGDY